MSQSGGETAGRRRRLRDVLREYVHAATVENAKFMNSKLETGLPMKAALGVNAFLGVGDKELWSGMGRGMAEIEAEFARHGTPEDQLCLRYVLYETAGSDATLWQHAGSIAMDSFANAADADGRAGKSLDYFVAHPSSVAAGLIAEHVVCLRLYTTAAFKSINDPLRGDGPFGSAPHPFPVTVAYLADGIKRLRAVCADEDDRNETRDFWRGMRNLEVPETFQRDGGTEYAPMSTSADLQVALRYSDRAERRLVFKVTTRGFIDRGADLRYLSAFPDEIEFLYPPLTFLRPTGNRDTILVGDIEYEVVEVEPRFAS